MRSAHRPLTAGLGHLSPRRGARGLVEGNCHVLQVSGFGLAPTWPQHVAGRAQGLTPRHPCGRKGPAWWVGHRNWLGVEPQARGGGGGCGVRQVLCSRSKHGSCDALRSPQVPVGTGLKDRLAQVHEGGFLPGMHGLAWGFPGERVGQP